MNFVGTETELREYPLSNDSRLVTLRVSQVDFRTRANGFDLS